MMRTWLREKKTQHSMPRHKSGPQKRLGYQSVQPARVTFLTSRSWWHPRYHVLLQKRLSKAYPSTHVVADVGQSSLLADLLRDDGGWEVTEANDSNVEFVEGEPGACHENVAGLLQRDELDSGWAGYALSEDGLWRHHSWGKRNGKIVETTVERLVYWGVPVRVVRSDLAVPGSW